MIPWWQLEDAGTRRRIVLLQVDIGGHSKWLEEEYAQNHFEPYKQRAELTEQIAFHLTFHRYHRVFWAGDGGLFAAKLDSAGHPEKACDAADAVFAVFAKWREQKNVELRVTATTLEITIDPDPGKWCCPGLNDFLKYERNIALPNAFVITQDLCATLVDASSLRRFPKSHRVPLPNGREMRCYIDTEHPHLVSESAHGFGAWLRQRAKDLSIIFDRSILRMSDCTVLDTAPRESGYGDIVFELQQSVPLDTALDEADRPKWKLTRDDLLAKKLSGTSLRVTRFVRELSGDPHPRLDYSTLPYVEARAFHTLLEEDATAPSRYRNAALSVMGDGTQLPNILSTGIVVIVGNTEPELLIANRKPRVGGYSGGSWSVSIVEQFMPVTGERAGRLLKADSSLEESVRRGVREELLGDDFAGTINVSTQAFYLDDSFDNFAFVAIVDLRPLTFREVASMWHNAPDHAEHQAIVALPATESVLRRCIESPGLPADVVLAARSNSAVEFAVGVEQVIDAAQQWQPSSHLRIAAAWWYVDRTGKGA